MTEQFAEQGFAPKGDLLVPAHYTGGVGMSTVYQVDCFSPEGELLWTRKAKNRVVTTGLNKLLDATFKTGLTSPTWFVGLCGPSVTDGVMTSGSPNLACTTSTPFTSADAGRPIIVRGAGASGADLVTTILTFTDSGHVVLNSNAGTAVSSAAVIFDARAGDTMASHTPWVESTAYSQSARPGWTPGSISAGSVDNSASQAVFTINANNTLIGGLFLCDNSTKGGTTGTLYGMAPFTVAFEQCNNGATLNVTATLTAASQ